MFPFLLCCSLVALSCLPLGDPMHCGKPGLPVHHQLIMSIELIIWQLRARTAAGLRVSCSLKYLWGTICSWHFLGAGGRTAGVQRPSHRQSHPSGEDRPRPNQRVVNFLGIKPYVCISSFLFPSALVPLTLHPVLLRHLYSRCHGSWK